MVAKILIAAGAACALLSSSPALAQEDALMSLSAGDVAATNQVMSTTNPQASNQGKAAIRSSKPMITAPHTAEFTELLITYSNRKMHTRIELGALGGGRADAPGLVHVGLGVNF